MASFSFGSGNIAKLLRIPVYLAGRLGTLLIPRGERWVFGCGAGIGDGALALWRLAAARGHDTLWLVSSERERSDAAARGIPTVSKRSLRGWWATARAEVLVVTHGFGDVNRYGTGGGFLVQLWHGIPLKRIGLDSSATTQVPAIPGAAVLSRIIGLLYRGSVRHIRILPAASDRSRGRLESAFGLDASRVLVTGEPRVDVLSSEEPAARRSAAQAVLTAAAGPSPEGARTILYAPTWRDGAEDPAIPTPDDWATILNVLEAYNAVLYVRSHPLGAGSYRPQVPTTRVRLLGSDILTDVTPALAAIDVLITDYSSMAYDVGLLAMPVLYLAPDAEEYTRTRGFYGSYAEVAGSDFARDWTALGHQLREILESAEACAERSARSAALSLTMHAHRDGQNTERVYRAIRARRSSASKGTE